MTALAKADELARLGRPAEAISLLEAAAREGDTGAQIEVGQWRLFGLYGPRDHAMARSLLRAAADAGSAEAGRLLANLVGNGTGGTADPAAARAVLESFAAGDEPSQCQLALLARMPAADVAAGLPQQQLSESPVIRFVRGLLTEDECSHVRAKAEPLLQPSRVIDPVTRRLVPNPVRTSLGTNFNPAQEDLVIQAINGRIAAWSGTDRGCGELLHVLCYRPGQEYRPHLDALPGDRNQRHITVLIYLNHGYEGGETRFPLLDLTVSGRTGDALLFHNVTAQGQIEKRSLHAGLPVTSGTKWLATRWIRQQPFDPWTTAPR